MWFGTQDGLNRFDGKRFTTIRSNCARNDSSCNFIFGISKMITALLADSRDQLWIGTTNGIVLYNRYLSIFIRPESIYNGLKLPALMNVKEIKEDKTGNIWIVDNDNLFYCYNTSEKKMETFSWQGNSSNRLAAITMDSAEKTWVSTDKEVYYLSQRSFKPINLNKKLGRSDFTINTIAFIRNRLWILMNGNEIAIIQNPSDNNSIVSSFENEFGKQVSFTDARLIHQSDSNTIWIGTRSEGVIKLNLNAASAVKSGASNNSNSLKSNFILSFFSNSQHITWIGMSGGLAKYDLQKMQFSLWRNEPKDNLSTPDNRVFSIYIDNNRKLFCGTLYDGLMSKDIQTGQYDYYQPFTKKYEENSSKNIYEIIAGENNSLWMATWAGLYNFDKSSHHFQQYINPDDERTTQLCSIIKLKTKHSILAGGYKGGLALFNLDSKKWELPNDKSGVLKNKTFRVRYMREFDNGDVYMSTEAQCFAKYNYLSGEFTFYPLLQRVSGTSRHFWFDNEFCWIATDDGLIQASSKDFSIIKVWTTNDGLPNDVIYAVVPDNHGRIWISTNNGLAAIYPQLSICKKFNAEDGLQDLEFNTAACYKTVDGKIWFGGVNGLNLVDPELTTAESYTAAPLITSILTMNEPYNSDSSVTYLHSLQLPFNKNFISFEFQSPVYSQTENVIYEYKLDGVDTGWVQNGTRNFVNYTQIAPGNYRFRVRSANNNYEWSPETTLVISIQPPWYKTWWFITFLMLLIISVLYTAYRFRINQVRKMERMRQRISADLHDDIGSSLTTINILSKLAIDETPDSNKRNIYLQNINEQTASVTESLRDIVWSINPENDKIEDIIDRMKRYAGQLLESRNIFYDLRIDKEWNGLSLDLLARQNFYLIFKEAINNLVKYSSATQVTISIFRDQRFLYMKVTDNGSGFDMATIKRGNGLNNMEKRAIAIHGKFQVNTQPGLGTQIELTVPVKDV